MTIYIHELKQSLKTLCVWTASIACMTLVCMLLFPEMKNEMNDVSDIFSNMGGFTDAFGMDKLNFGELMGFYGIECGNIVGLGGGFFAGFIGISALAKEEKDRTAEFLLTHPVDRFSVVTQKLLSVLTQIVILNLVTVTVSLLSTVIIRENFEIKSFLLLHLALLSMQIEISCICFGISAFIKRGSMGIGLGLTITLYFLNIISNITDKAKFLRFITPYSYAEASKIIPKASIDPILISVGAVICVAGVSVAFFKYIKKDISS